MGRKSGAPIVLSIQISSLGHPPVNHGYTGTHFASAIDYDRDYWVMLNPAEPDGVTGQPGWCPYLLGTYHEVELAVYNGHVCLGKAHTPASDGTGGSGGSNPVNPPSGGGGDDSGCPCLWMYFDDATSVAQTKPELMLDCLDVYSGRQYREPVKRNRKKRARSYLLLTENGALFAGSWDTPFDLPDGRCTRCELMLGELVATDDGPGTPIAWSHVVRRINVGTQYVMGIDLGGKTFACGVKGSKRVYSHNSRAMKAL